MTGARITPERTTVVVRLLTGLVAIVCRWPRLVLALSLLAVGLSIVFFCTRLEYRTQRDDLVSEKKATQQRWRKYLAEFGDDDDVVAVIEGSDRQRMRLALESLAGRIEQHPDLFDRLFYKVDLRHLRNRALLFLPAGEISQIRANLQPMSILLELGIVGWKSLSLSNLLTEAKLRLDKLSPGQPLSAADEQFLTQLHSILASASASLAHAGEYRNPWRSLMPASSNQPDLLAKPQYFFSKDDKHDSEPQLAFLLVRPVKEAGSFTAAQKGVETLRDIVQELKPTFKDLHFGLTGLPVLETDEMAASQKDTEHASWLAIGGVALLYLVVFRSFRFPALTVGTMLIGTAWAMGWLTLTVGHLNILSATFAVMLVGMGDYGVLWVTRYEQNRANGADVTTALRLTAAGGGPSILTAATATALAFFAAMFADFQAVVELGWIAGCGVLLCALACFTVLPALLALSDRRGNVTYTFLPGFSSSSRFGVAGRAWFPFLNRRPEWVFAGSLAAAACMAFFAFQIKYDHNLLNLQARGLDAVHWEKKLLREMAGANWHALSYTATQEDALALKAKFDKLPEVSRVVEIASLVPLDQEQKLPLLRDIRHRLRNVPGPETTIPRLLPDPVRLTKEATSLLSQLLPLQPAAPQRTLTNLLDELTTFVAQLRNSDSESTGHRLQLFEQRMAADLASNLRRLLDVATPEPVTLADLPPRLRERYLSPGGKWLLRVFAKESLWDHEPLERFVQQIRTVDPDATGKPFGTLEGLEDLRGGFEWAGLYALAAILIVFCLDFRRPGRTLLAFLPLGMGVILSLGIMGLIGLPLNPANVIAFPLILGVGAVYGVHVVHDYLVCRENRAYSLSYVIGRAIFVMALTNIISFGSLMLARHAGLFSLGLVLTLGVTCCMATALVFLPALLRIISEPAGETSGLRQRFSTAQPSGVNRRAA